MPAMTVNHRLGSYEIRFESLGDALAGVPENSIFTTDENVFHIYGEYMGQEPMVLPAGEQTKSIRVFEQCLETLARRGVGRSASVVAFGGGVIGDLAGFVASAYMRGIEYVQIPSTLLAQVDSAVGGKVGVDLTAGKNLAGAFYPPGRVHICLELLDTLDRRQFRNGMAEVWKYGFIADESLVNDLASGLSESNGGVEEIVVRCLEIKREVVSQDEFEKTGLRAILNYGHTIGHAIEQVTGYKSLLHGEAISIGMCMEARLGEALGFTRKGTALEVDKCLRSQGLPTENDVAVDAEQLIEAMRRDKKRKSSNLAFSLLTQIGECKLVTDVAVQDVERVLREQ